MPKITIKAARVNAGLTQRQAAKRLGIAYQTLSNYESGASIPRVDMLEKMSKLYCIDKQYIFLGKQYALVRKRRRKMEIFEFENSQVGVVEENSQVWFVGKDVANILGYARPTKAIHDHVDQEDQCEKIVTISQLSQNGTPQNTLLITESGVYSLIFASKLPAAKKFKHWVTSEVLPSIRRHGAYLTDKKLDEVLLNPDTIIKLATDVRRRFGE